MTGILNSDTLLINFPNYHNTHIIHVVMHKSCLMVHGTADGAAAADDTWYVPFTFISNT